jgi:hypothetical protein
MPSKLRHHEKKEYKKGLFENCWELYEKEKESS